MKSNGVEPFQLEYMEHYQDVIPYIRVQQNMASVAGTANDKQDVFP